MYKLIKSFLVVISIVALAACTPVTPDKTEDPYTFETRTYYESLDLSTPEAAVETFVEAYEAGDFFTVYLSMTFQSIFSWQGKYIMFEYEGLANTAYKTEIRDDILSMPFEHAGDFWSRFVSMMDITRQRGALLLDFGDEVNILRTEETDPVGAYISPTESPAVEVYAIVEHIPGEVVFTVVQSPGNRWRIHQVAIAGGDENMLPWSAPPLDETISIPASPAEKPGSYLDVLSTQLSTPEGAIETFADAFRRGDFHAVYLILSPFTQEAWVNHVRRFENNYLWDPEFQEAISAEVVADIEYTAAWYMFDRGMLAAKDHNALLIDLSGDINIIEVGEIQTIDGDKYYGELKKVEVRVIAEFVPGEVTFVMLQMPSGDWRVQQVIVPGGDRKIIPWSIPD